MSFPVDSGRKDHETPAGTLLVIRLHTDAWVYDVAMQHKHYRNPREAILQDAQELYE